MFSALFLDNLDNRCLFCLCVAGHGTVRDSVTRDDLEWPGPKISSTICLIIWTSFRTWIPISSFMTTIHCFECWYPSKNIKWVIFFQFGTWLLNHIGKWWKTLQEFFRKPIPAKLNHQKCQFLLNIEPWGRAIFGKFIHIWTSFPEIGLCHASEIFWYHFTMDALF